MSSDVLIGDARAQSARARESASAAGAIERSALGADARRGEAIGGAGVGDAICERNGAMGLRKRGHEVSFAVDCVRALPAVDVLFEHMRVDGPLHRSFSFSPSKTIYYFLSPSGFAFIFSPDKSTTVLVNGGCDGAVRAVGADVVHLVGGRV